MTALPPTQAILPAPVCDRPAMMAAFGRFMDRETKDGEAKPDTVKAYYQAAKTYIDWCDATGINPATADDEVIIDFRRHLKAQKYKPKSVQLYLTGVRQLYRSCVRAKLLTSNPAAEVRAPGDGTSEVEHIKALTEDALRALLAAIPRDTLPGQRDRAIIGLMAIHGLRRGEVQKLSHSDIDPGDNFRVRVNGKGGKIRSIYLRQDTLSLLRQFFLAKEANGYDVGHEAPLFMSVSNNNHGGRLNRNTLNRIVDDGLSDANLKRAGISCHALRHTFGTLAVAGGAKVEQLRDAMGHSKLETTGLYVQAVERQKNNPANFIGVGVLD